MPRRIKIHWTCSDSTHHEHRWYWTAWLCAQMQRAYWLVRVMLAR